MSISGFPEFLPDYQIAFNRVISVISDIFELYGFTPLDTPAVERVSTLLAKGNDNEIYGIHRLADTRDKKDLALRFDLTVPLARYVAEHCNALTFPYKRYHVAPVWRGERAQSGRYRQFYQCDIDIIGDGQLDYIYDAEIAHITNVILTKIKAPNFTIKINNRQILSGLIKSFGDYDVNNIMRILDKASKIDEEVLTNELLSEGLSENDVVLLRKLNVAPANNEECIEYLDGLCDHPEFRGGLEELRGLLLNTRYFNVSDSVIQISPMLARGLSYYTGTVFEVVLNDYPELGSICGGGRYANLATAFTKRAFPGIGISLGVSRLVPKLIEIGALSVSCHTPTQVLVTTQDKKYIKQYVEIAQMLREAGINTDLYMTEKPLGAQLRYADRTGVPLVVIADYREFDFNKITLKNMSSGEQATVDKIDLIGECLHILNSSEK